MCLLFFIKFLFFTKWYFFKNYEKCFFISSKKLFLFLRYSIFCIFAFRLFLPVSHCFRSWSKKNVKVYDVNNCLNKNLISYFVSYLEKEIKCDIETLSIDRVLNKEHFYGKSCKKCAPEANPRILFNFTK